MSKNRFDLFDDNDDFWNLEKMLPKKKIGAVFSSDTDTVQIEVRADASTKGTAIPPIAEQKRKISDSTSERLRIAKEAMKLAEAKHHLRAASSFGDRAKNNAPAEASPQPDEVLYSYSPKANPLIKEVTVKLWPSRYSFYEQFHRDAVKHYSTEGKKCPHVPFFSFTPQYSQLSQGQLEFYFYFRASVRNGSAIKADYSYILLLIYEIINLPDLIPSEDGLSLLLFIWENYRNEYPKLDRHLSEWVCDYCLIHKIEGIPHNFAITGEAARLCRLKEFYVRAEEKASPFASALFEYAPTYDYRSSKYINDENRHLFDKHVREAFVYAFTKAEREHQTIFAPIGDRAMIPLKAVRDSYNGALCVYSVKRRIEVSFLSCSRSAELRYAVTDAVKFAENKVRAMLGIRSRFHTPNLALPLKNAIEEYFAPFQKEAKKQAEKEAVPEYDALYEPRSVELSLSDAKSIEEHSWTTTELLTDGLEEFTDDDAASSVAPEVSFEAPSRDDKPEWMINALSAVIDGDRKSFSDLCHSMGMLPDALVSALNDKMYDVIGDIVIEHGEDGYNIVVDYMEEITEWMKK